MLHSWHLDNLQVMVQYDVDHSVQLLLGIFTKYWILAKLQDASRKLLSNTATSRNREGFVGRFSSRAFVNCLQLLAWICQHSDEPLSNHCKMQMDKAWTFSQIIIVFYVACALHTVVWGILDISFYIGFTPAEGITSALVPLVHVLQSMLIILRSFPPWTQV